MQDYQISACCPSLLKQIWPVPFSIMASATLTEELASLDLTEQELRADPCMASCCLQDIKQQREGAILKAALLAQDRTTQRQKLIAASLQPGFIEASPQGDLARDACRDEDGEEEEEEVLMDIRMKRMKEMQRVALAQKAEGEQGYGQLNHVPESRLLERLEGQEGCCVCHLAVSGYQPCDELDQQLESMAHQWRGTCFIRCLVGRRSALPQQLGTQGAPVLVSCKDGAVVGRAGLDMFGPAGDIFQEEVERYLKRLRVLKASRTSGSKEGGGGRGRTMRPGGSASDGDSEGEEEEEGQGGVREGEEEEGGCPACETCGRRYPHTHVKALYREHHEGGSDEDSDDLDM